MFDLYFRVALNEMYRILRKGESFICSFPMDSNVELLEEDPLVITEKERILKYGQNDHKRLFGMNADRFLSEAGFSVKKISGEKCTKKILPIVGPADYDINLLFRFIKNKIAGEIMLSISPVGCMDNLLMHLNLHTR